jgi:pyruvate dehydrogenase E2 component (dihydrolipoamide acetyltransferase)
MAVVVIMPKQGQSVESCIISEITKKKGETVKKGETLFVYETDKASFEEESPADGVVLESFFNEGDEVPVLSNMMIIGQPGEDYASLLGEAPAEVSAAETTPEPSATAIQTQVETVDIAPAAAGTTPEARKFTSPRARKLAEKEAIDTNKLAGSGPRGRVIEKDVQAEVEKYPKKTALAKKIIQSEGLTAHTEGSGLAGTVRSADLLGSGSAHSAADYVDTKLSNMRKLIAKSMHASLQNSAQLTHHLGADARAILALRKKVKAAIEAGTIDTNITLNDMICFAVIRALKIHPNVNAHFLGDTMRVFKKMHLGLSVDTYRGLMVPVVREADDLSLKGLTNQLKKVAVACRKGNISPDLLSPEAATFTVSNLGNYGVEMFTPVINLPQAAILGVNTILPRPKELEDGVYAFVPHVGLSLTYDHRALDGGKATRFLKQVADEIENLSTDII